MDLYVYEIVKKSKNKHLVWLLDRSTGQLFKLPITVRR